MRNETSKNNATEMVTINNQEHVEIQIEGYLLGKVLTIIDASYQDTTQREAVKSLIKEKFHSQIDWMFTRRAEAGSSQSAKE